VLDDVFDIALNRVKLGFAQILDLLGQMLDVEAVVALEVRAQRLRLLLGPGVEVLVVELGGLGRHACPHSSIESGSST
jgi:hypothetical protein